MLDHLPSRLAVAWGLREALRAFTALPAFCVSYLSGARVKWQFDCRNQGQCGSMQAPIRAPLTSRVMHSRTGCPAGYLQNSRSGE